MGDMNIFELMNGMKEALPSECTDLSVTINKDAYVFAVHWDKGDELCGLHKSVSFLEIKRMNMNSIWWIDMFIREVHHKMNPLLGEEDIKKRIMQEPKP